MLDFFYSNNCNAMTKSMRVAAKAAESSAARLCVAAAEASQPHPEDTYKSAGSQHQPATSVAGSRGALLRKDVELTTQSRRFNTNCVTPGLAPG